MGNLLSFCNENERVTKVQYNPTNILRLSYTCFNFNFSEATTCMWSEHEVLMEGQYVVENPIAQETDPKSLKTLHGDIMELITSL